MKISKENKRFYIDMIKKQLSYAESKHPEFAHYFDADILIDLNENLIKDIKRRLEIRRKHNETLEKTKMVGALEILQEEVFEANLSFLEEDYDNCLQELAQCGAVIIRMMDLVCRIRKEKVKEQDKFW